MYNMNDYRAALAARDEKELFFRGMERRTGKSSGHRSCYDCNWQQGNGNGNQR